MLSAPLPGHRSAPNSVVTSLEASPARRGLGSSGGSDYAADDYLRNKDEHGLTRDDLDDLGYHNNPHAQYDE